MLDLAKTYYSGQRVIRIIGEDGNPDVATINEQQADKILNDINVGRYDVIMETGPGYNTKRQEASTAMIDLAKAMPEVMHQGADIIVGQMDFPAARQLAERLKMANPIAQAQEQIPKDIDPKAQAMIGQLMGQLHQAQQQLQQLTQEKQAKIMGLQVKEQLTEQRELKLSTEREIAETHRLHIKEKGDNYRAQLAAHTKMHDVMSRDNTSMHETIIDNQTDLEIAHHANNTRGEPNTNTHI